MDALLRRHYMMTRLRPASHQVISYRASTFGTGAASIAKIKGRTDAWNQLINAVTSTFNECTLTLNANGSYTLTGTPSAARYKTMSAAPNTAGHKLLLVFRLVSGASVSIYDENNVAAAGSYHSDSFSLIYAPTNNAKIVLMRSANATQDAVFYLHLYDLTLQYGAGREPATVAAFLAEYPEALTAPYNAGKLILNKVTALVTDGFNQIDLSGCEFGTYNSTTGALVDSTSVVRCWMPVVGGASYYIKMGTNLRQDSNGIGWYDAGHNYLGNAYYNTNLVVAPLSAAYGLVVLRAVSGTITLEMVRNSEFCINLSHSGIRNGEYEPYWTSTLNLDHAKIYGRLNGAGEMVQVAPNGFRGVGSNYDEVDIVRKEAYIRRAWVDMGTLNWYRNPNECFYAYLTTKQPGVSAMCCAKYPYVGNQGFAVEEKVISNTSSSGNEYIIFVKDSNYSTAAAFKTAMSGVMLDYRLATPLHYTDLMYSEDGGQTFIELPSNYRVDDFGTERRLPNGIVDGAPASTPLVADIRYPW